jgi:hypothetical protein
MPTFASTLRASGRAGRPQGRSGGTGSNILGVASNGTGNMANVNVTIKNGNGTNFVPRAVNQSRTSWELEIDSNKSKYRGTFTINGTIPLGLTKDSSGSALGSCRVDLFETGSNRFIASTVSDVSGNYSFTVPSNSQTYYCRAYKEGVSNLFGTTDETIKAV